MSRLPPRKTLADTMAARRTKNREATRRFGAKMTDEEREVYLKKQRVHQARRRSWSPGDVDRHAFDLDALFDSYS